MKKLLLIFVSVLLCSHFIAAQSLTILYNGAPLTNGAEITLNGEISSDPFYEVKAYARVKNNTDRTVNVMAKRVEHDTVTGTENYFCWGQCFPPNVSISPNPTPIAANDTTPHEFFTGYYTPKQKPGTSIIKYVFFIESDVNDSISFIVNYVVSPSSLNDLRATSNLGNAFPNPASEKVSINYELPFGTSQAQIKIFNLMGQAVAEQQLFNSRGKAELNLSNLKEGVYFYSLHINNQAVATKKLIVRR